MSVPTMLGYIAHTLYDLVDMAWIGKISSEAVAAVTIVTSLFWLISVLNGIIGTGSVALISQNYGAGNHKQTRKCIEQTLTFKFFVATIAMILLAIFMKPLIVFFSKDQLVQTAAFDYGYIRIFFLPIMFATYSINTALRCIGDSKSPLILMVITSVLNIILDPIFMFETVPLINIPGLALGVFGAALATVIANLVGFTTGLFILFSLKNKEIRPTLKGIVKLNPAIDKKLITIGFPNGVENLFRQLAHLTTLKIMTTFGTATIAALGIQQRLSGFFVMPILGLMMGGGTVVGQNMGAEKTTHYAALLGAVIMSVITILVLLFTEPIMRIFVNDAEVIKIRIPMLRIITPSYIFLGIAFGFSSGFTGAGYNTPFMISAMIARWGVQIPFMILTVYILNLSVTFIWVSFALSEIAEFVVTTVIYGKGTWKTRRVSHLI